MTSQQRSILALGSFAVSVVGLFIQFGVGVALIVAGAFGVVLALILAIGAVR